MCMVIVLISYVMNLYVFLIFGISAYLWQMSSESMNMTVDIESDFYKIPWAYFEQF